MTELMEKGFVAGNWYKWVGSKVRPPYFNAYGGMDFILSGTPVQCKFVIDKYEAVLGEPTMNSLWWWEEAVIEKSIIKVTDIEEIQPYVPIIVDIDKARFYLNKKVRASMFYRFLQSTTMDVTEGILREISSVDNIAPFIVEAYFGNKAGYQFIQPVHFLD
jgi:hypothetical protein